MKYSFAIAILGVALLAGCSGEKKDAAFPSSTPEATAPAKQEIRKEFIVIRELLKQHEAQKGNDTRIETVERLLKEKFPALPDKGENDTERQIYQDASSLLENLN